MALFRRRRREGEDKVGRRVVVTDDLGIDEYENPDYPYDDGPAPEPAAADSVSSLDSDYRREDSGPYDRSEVEDRGDRVDLGGVWLAALPGAELRIEVDPETNDVQAVTTGLNGSSMQIQAFAAPRSAGIWDFIRDEIAEGVTTRGGTADLRNGPLGTELLTRLPSRGPDGRTVYQVMRFIGVDGPRWFLRAVLTGPAASQEYAAEPFYRMISNSVVIRGTDARPPREMLPLRLPKELMEANGAGPEGQSPSDALRPFERGPEITEIR
ncbi:Protein of unknown function [Austwickia chelonae]|uniref:DUF3710 domain-containing protein n=1 Tax=Austwickia chelonae NBRC 105200 TaxID=1184607 RepID=K6W6Y9_9MICO|nr:DUF3710 domain-containing protein [Austwickia chelonae]GAB77592.1 hypothetical protein AUCHE_05_05050 [Austwickia chelonae NBRC 105200]SEW13637.1 Protein of unknown function [Austwickia chelonae]